MISGLIRFGLVWVGLAVVVSFAVGAWIQAGRRSWLRDAFVPPCGCPDDCSRMGR